MTEPKWRRGTRADCATCDKPIVFEPYYRDGKPGPNPDVWFHLPGDFFCWVPGVDDQPRAKPRRAAPPDAPVLAEPAPHHPVTPYEGWVSV
ncbi:hypothetical protein [Lentzea cavernae]|uniref:Uncharacterized protein n=1 Tax=Lentzea cavernae TaxID=2020703 RepID=A0ABQ3MRS4_9PSEU|nr:hypothetical protein [Lentzea cavernae]GHH57807.1 hypothetical protein GCM10017774_78120 [Lentzea cavernae]